MQRRRFLQTSLAALPLAAASAALAAPAAAADRPGKGFKASAGEGRYHGHIQLKGVNQNVLDVKVSGRDTGGDLAIFEQTSLSPGRGTPLHVHLGQDEIFHVLDGEYAFLVGEERFRLRPGDTIFLPRQVPHAWTQVSPRGRMTVIMQPAGKLEEFFVAMAAFKGEPTPQEVAQLFAAHEMKVVGPPLKVD
jgi:quercetin dioxygenase-like cupin family protein